MIVGAVLGSLLGLCCLLAGIWALVCCCSGEAGACGGSRSVFGYSNGSGGGGGACGGACGDLSNEIR